jgi:hypothetical protein
MGEDTVVDTVGDDLVDHMNTTSNKFEPGRDEFLRGGAHP